MTSTPAEINILDGDNTASSVTLADADRIIVNDNGTMKQVAVSALNTYTSASIAADDISAGDGAVNITTSSGNITIDTAAGDADIIFKGTDDSADITALTLDMSAAGEAIFNAGITIADAGTIGSASDKDAIAIGSDGDVTLTQDLELQHDGAILSFGANDEVTLTHVHDTGILINSTNVIQFNDASQNIGAPSNAILDINATDEIELNATLVDVNANLDVSGTIVGASTISGTTITATTAFVPDASDGAALGTTALEFSDLFLADGAVIGLGDDQEVTLTHVADTGITLNSTNKLMFNDASQFIQGASATVLDIAATDEIELTATLIEIVGNSTVSGTLGVTGVLTADAGVVVDNITIDGTEIDLSSGDLTVDVAGDIILDAGGGNVKVSVATTQILDIANSSSDVIIKPVVDAKDIIFQQRDGTSILEINDGAYARFTAAAVAPEATLTDASTVTWNALTQSVAKVTLGGNRTIGLASGGIAGAFISILIIQDGTGSRTVTWNAAYEFAADTAPTLTTTANLGDLFVFRYNGAKWLETGRNLALTLS